MCLVISQFFYMPTETISELLDRRRDFLGFVRRRVADPAIAEDILQSAYLRAVQHSSGLRQDESIVAWFYRILRNAVIDHYRHRGSENATLDRWATELGTSPEEASALAPHDPATFSFVCHCIEAVLPSLTPNYAQLIREVDLDEAPLADFAHRHGITAGNAAVRAHRARAALKRALIRTCGACSTHGCLNCSCECPAAAMISNGN